MNCTRKNDPDLSRRAKEMMLDKMDGTAKVCKLNKALCIWFTPSWPPVACKIMTVYTDNIKKTFIFVYVDEILMLPNNRAREG